MKGLPDALEVRLENCLANLNLVIIRKCWPDFFAKNRGNSGSNPPWDMDGHGRIGGAVDLTDSGTLSKGIRPATLAVPCFGPQGWDKASSWSPILQNLLAIF